MALMIKAKKSAVWIDFPGEAGASFLIKPLTLSELGVARSTVRRKVAIPVASMAGSPPSANPFQFTDDVDDFELSRAIFLHVLQDWKGVEFDWEGDTANHSKDDEKGALFNIQEVREFIVTRAQEMGEEFGKKRKDEEKN